MARRKISTYWPAAAAVLLSATVMLSVGQSRARYVNTSVWNTVVSTQNGVELVLDGQKIVDLGLLSGTEETVIPFSLNRELEAEEMLTCQTADVITASITQDEAGAMSLHLTVNSSIEALTESWVYILSGEECVGTFRFLLPVMEIPEETTEEISEETTEETSEETTDETVTEATEVTEMTEVTQATDPVQEQTVEETVEERSVEETETTEETQNGEETQSELTAQDTETDEQIESQTGDEEIPEETEETQPEEEVAVITFSEVTLAEKALAVQISVTEQMDYLLVTLGEGFPALTEYTTADGACCILYYGGTVWLPWSENIGVNFSFTSALQMPEGLQTLTAESYDGQQQAQWEILFPTTMTPLVWNPAEGDLEIPLPEQMASYAPQITIVTAQGDAAQGPEYEISEDGLTLSLKVGEEQPLPGTYRLDIKWNDEDICLNHSQMTFFINYWQAQTIGGAEE